MSTSREAGPSGSASRRTKAFEYQGLKLKVPPKMPFAALQYLVADAGAREIVGFLRLLLGDEQLETVWDAGFDLAEGTGLVKEITELYGVKTGESEASPNS